MRANHRLAGTKSHLVLHSNPGLARLDLFWIRSIRRDRPEIYSVAVRRLISVGAALSLWMLIGLTVSLMV